ncbi:MAG: thymidine phosphorylase, partial [Pseudomonadota bacterium]
GAAIVGASAKIAPADKRLYAIRDVTATVQSLDLITASILSKKLAAGLDGLVLDVKTGSGAIMKDETEANALAEALVQTANALGCKTSAVLTDMSQPLVPAMGNALEVLEIARLLTQAKRAPVVDVALALGGVLLADAAVTHDAQAGAELLWDKIRNGAAAERFAQMIAAQGGPMGFMDNPGRYLPEATVMREITATEPGFVSALDGEALGLAVVGLGGGRQVEGDVIDPAVGFSGIIPLGSKLTKGDVLAVVHASHPDQADQAVATLRRAIKIGSAPPKLPDLIKAKVA